MPVTFTFYRINDDITYYRFKVHLQYCQLKNGYLQINHLSVLSFLFKMFIVTVTTKSFMRPVTRAADIYSQVKNFIILTVSLDYRVKR